jgi:hypothetical protein
MRCPAAASASASARATGAWRGRISTDVEQNDAHGSLGWFLLFPSSVVPFPASQRNWRIAEPDPALTKGKRSFLTI